MDLPLGFLLCDDDLVPQLGVGLILPPELVSILPVFRAEAKMHHQYSYRYRKWHFLQLCFQFFLNHGRKNPKYKSIKSNLRGHVLQQASIQHIHVPVGNISFNLTATAVAPERLLRLGAVKLFYLGFFKCSTSFFHLGNNA